MESRVKITFWNDCDFGEKDFSSGFQQSIYLDACWDVPSPLVVEDSKSNGQGEVIIKARSVLDRCVFEADNIPDEQLNILNNLESYKNVTIFDSLSGEAVTAKNVQFESRQQNNGCLNIGRIIFSIFNVIKTGCCPGNPNSGQPDTLRLTLVNPDDASATYKYYLVNDSVDVPIQARAIITGDCTGEYSNEVVTNANARTSKICSLSGPNSLQDGGFIDSMTVYDTTSGMPTTIDLNPGTTTHRTAPGGGTGTGDLTGTDLTFDSGNAFGYAPVLKTLITNALYNVFGANADANFIVNTGSNSLGNVTVNFTNKHNPSGLWIGFLNTMTNVLTFDRNDGGGVDSYNTINSGSSSEAAYLYTGSTPCGDLTYNDPSISDTLFVDRNASEYNNIVLTAGPVAIGPDDTGPTEITCLTCP